MSSDTSLSLGISESLFIPNCSRKLFVVEYSKGLPGPSPLPCILIKLRDNNVFITPDESTPLIASMSYLPMGCLYATMANVSKAADDKVS